MDFNYKLARTNTELFKQDFSKGLQIADLQVIGSGSNYKVYMYKNLVIKQLLKEWAKNRDDKKIEMAYNKLLVKFSDKGIAQNLKFAPILDFAKRNDKFYTISPFVDGTELPDCTDEQLREIGVDGMKRYIENNHKLSKIQLSPEFHDLRNFKLTPQGNINVIDYSTWWFVSRIKRGYPIKLNYMKKEMESINWKSCARITNSIKDRVVLDNMREAFEQTQNSNSALNILSHYNM